MTMNAKTAHANFFFYRKDAILKICTDWVFITRKNSLLCRRLIRMSQRYMLTIVGLAMFDLDI